MLEKKIICKQCKNENLTVIRHEKQILPKQNNLFAQLHRLYIRRVIG